METKKYLSLEGLQQYDALIKQQIADAVAEKAEEVHTHVVSDVEGLETALDAKADASHDHNTLYYTRTEVDNMEFITVDDIDTICGGTIQVASLDNEVTF